MVALDDLVRYADALLEVDRFDDYAPNGLQIEGRGEVAKIVAGVTASLELVEAAIRRGADAIVVHHGYFWKNEDPRVIGMKRRRLARILASEVSLIGYHLPLDAHPQLGNNIQLAHVLGIGVIGPLPGCGGSVPVLHGELPRPMTAAELKDHLHRQLGRVPLHLAGAAPEIRRVAWCTGAAQGYFEPAAVAGVDAYISGEVSEPTTHIARETGIHYFAAGHHATERYGVQALAAHLAEKFSLQFDFVDVPNPV